ncbi:E3 ubiquitin-protein ligase RNF10-like [Ylistrum balloti]|uniref:E3 ubiquitin-protein ligase RNF10-like n=1 Tax=Ylistrum balloti TaxID=509963 RepID=UPI002905E835|nr:E3 ubiquitin-protein ligase RNF10-like [Ylistrum balloti]
MSQEVLENMDRKPGNRTSSVPPKGNGNENKKSDSGTQKQYPRAPKRREGYSNRSQNEQGVRRPTPQKSRGMEDKRPRSRGTYREREDVSDQYQDYENVLNSRRKVNLNHLLNFSYNEPERHHGDGYTGRSNRSRVRNLRYNKEQFLQANCQFVVSQKGDYTIHNHNPDTLVDWDSVELIRVQSSETSSCPICLQSPVAAKMTRCGHIYCWACILHYLALGEKTWRKCPICYESIHDKDLRSVESKEVHQYKVGETITLRLMKRQKGKVYALPKSCKDKELGKFFSVKDSDLETRYMKILLASKEEIRKHVLSVERTALETQKVDAENSEMPFIDGALAMLKAREDANECFVSRKITTQKAAEPQSDIIPIPVKPLKTGKAAKVYKSAFSDEEDETAEKKTKERHTSEESLGSPKGSPHSEGIGKSPVDISSLDTSNNSVPTDISTVSGSPENPCTSLPPGVMADTMPTEEAAEHLEMPSHPDVVSPSSKAGGGADGAFYFYQAEDGQHIYLHALNARCLVKEYGALQHCPDTITATIVEMENIFMTEDLRKRLRYLGHLPLTCEFQVVELAIKPPIISKETLKFFSDDIEKRRRMRQRKHREERRRTKKIQDDEKKKMGITPDVTIVPSQFVPGVMSENRPSSPAAQSDDSNTSSMAHSPLDSGSYLNPLCPDFLSRTEADVETEGDQTTSVSFAQMLIAGKRQVPVWPKAAARGGDTASVIARGRTVSRGSEDSDPEDKVPVPEYHNSFGDAFQTALDNLHQLSPKGDVESNPPQATSGGKKKKKQQKLLLFSTSMARGGK